MPSKLSQSLSLKKNDNNKTDYTTTEAGKSEYGALRKKGATPPLPRQEKNHHWKKLEYGISDENDKVYVSIK